MFIPSDQVATVEAIEALGIPRDDANQIYEELTPYEVSAEKIADVVLTYVDDSRIAVAIISILTGDNDEALQYIAEHQAAI